MKWVIRITSIVIIVVCAVWGLYQIGVRDTGNEDAGVAMVNLLYTYEGIREVYDRQEQIHSLCTEETWETLAQENNAHWDGTWERTRNSPSTVRVVFTRPGLVVYALENAYVYPQDLWCFEYELVGGKFSNVREYKLVGMRESKDGGFF